MRNEVRGAPFFLRGRSLLTGLVGGNFNGRGRGRVEGAAVTCQDSRGVTGSTISRAFVGGRSVREKKLGEDTFTHQHPTSNQIINCNREKRKSKERHRNGGSFVIVFVFFFFRFNSH